LIVPPSTTTPSCAATTTSSASLSSFYSYPQPSRGLLQSTPATSSLLRPRQSSPSIPGVLALL
jgi:hypothetical protein